ncbi:hypothetical protein [Noviherbaspirillum cavernae]|nr:hypothetical protein [Noviherbaspirillum cavernae]
MNYRGYQIVAKPICPGGSGSMWYGGYDILKDGKTVASRTNIFPATLYFRAACSDSIETAKTEVDNLAGRASGGVG